MLHTSYKINWQVSEQLQDVLNEKLAIYIYTAQSYGLHSYGKLGQPDTEIEYIFGTCIYHQNVYKMGTGHQA